MNFLIFDTETSGFPNPKLEYNHPEQAKIVQLACLVLDEKFNEIGCFNSLIKRKQQFTIDDGAYNAHNISLEDCNRYGIDIEVALNLFKSFWFNSFKVIAHNYSFDKKMIDIEHWALNESYLGNIESNICTMEAMTPIMRLPSKIPGKYKWPKLQEAYRFIHGQEFEDAHDALADVRATAKIFRWLVTNGYYKIESKDNIKETLAQ